MSNTKQKLAEQFGIKFYETSCKTGDNVEKAFKNADPDEKQYLAFIRQIVMRFKSNALVTARGLDRVLRAAISAAKSRGTGF